MITFKSSRDGDLIGEIHHVPWIFANILMWYKMTNDVQRFDP